METPGTRAASAPAQRGACRGWLKRCVELQEFSSVYDVFSVIVLHDASILFMGLKRDDGLHRAADMCRHYTRFRRQNKTVWDRKGRCGSGGMRSEITEDFVAPRQRFRGVGLLKKPVYMLSGESRLTSSSVYPLRGPRAGRPGAAVRLMFLPVCAACSVHSTVVLSG